MTPLPQLPEHWEYEFDSLSARFTRTPGWHLFELKNVSLNPHEWSEVVTLAPTAEPNTRGWNWRPHYAHVGESEVREPGAPVVRRLSMCFIVDEGRKVVVIDLNPDTLAYELPDDLAGAVRQEAEEKASRVVRWYRRMRARRDGFAAAFTV